MKPCSFTARVDKWRQLVVRFGSKKKDLCNTKGYSRNVSHGELKNTMTCMRYTMLLFSVLELLLFGYTAGVSSDEHASPGARLPRAVLDETLEATTIPNHLQEDDRDSRFSPFTPTFTITSRDFRTTEKTNQLQPFWLTTTVAPLTKTMDPTSKRSEVKENSTFTSTLNITVKPTSSSPLSGTKSPTPPAVDTTNSSWTVKSTSKPPVVTTERGRVTSHSSQWHDVMQWASF